MELGLKDKVVVCLSSAAGIGKGIAAEAAREGAKVVICTAEAYKEDLLTAQAEIEKETGNRPYTFFYDVKDAASIKKLIDDVAAQLGGVYALVNHCPGPKAASFEDLTEEDWEDGYEKCLHSYIHAIRAALPYMKTAGEGRILNSTSSSIKSALDNLILSNTFRMGVVGMSKTMAREFGQYGILVNTMGPGRIYTDRIKYLNKIRGEKLGISKDSTRSKLPSSKGREPTSPCKNRTFERSNSPARFWAVDIGASDHSVVGICFFSKRLIGMTGRLVCHEAFLFIFFLQSDSTVG